MSTPPLARHLQRFLYRFATALLFLSSIAATTAHAQTFTVLYSFTGGADGNDPFAGVIRDSAGNLYGTTSYGGTGTCVQDFVQGCGTVFRVTEAGSETVLYNFLGGTDGQLSQNGVTFDRDGYLFGTTVDGGLDFGTFFRLDQSGNEQVLHRFTGGTDGAYPDGALVRDNTGNLFGTASEGGDLGCGFEDTGCGTVFEVGANQGHVIHRFKGTPSDGAYPGAVLIDSTGNLYGATTRGGAADAGTIYKIDQNGNYTVLYSFLGSNDGCELSGNLALDENGDLYGAASACGELGRGTVFEINAAGSFSVLHAFSGAAGDGNSPFGGVTRDHAGNLYGTTLFGGGCDMELGGCGIVFKLNPSGSLTILHAFDGYTDGSSPWSNVILDPAGNIYGTTSLGGLNGSGGGTVWEISP